MPNTINRLHLLNTLEFVEPGISSTATIAQSNCLVFRRGFVYSFTGEILCRAKTDLPEDIVAAVQGKPMIEALRALPAKCEELSVDFDGESIKLSDNRNLIEVHATAEIDMPIKDVDRPEKWFRLPDSFVEGTEMVSECTASDKEALILASVHLTPTHVEAFDNTSFARYQMKVPLKKSVLVRASALKAVITRGPHKMAETNDWLHFGSSTGLYIAVRKFNPVDYGGVRFDALSKIVGTKGKPISFPKSVVAASKVSEIFSGENTDDDRINVSIKDGVLRMVGEGVSGRHTHRVKVAYSGPAIAFRIGPLLLGQLVEKYTQIEYCDEKLLVNGESWFLCLSMRQAVKRVQKEESTGE